MLPSLGTIQPMVGLSLVWFHPSLRDVVCTSHDIMKLNVSHYVPSGTLSLFAYYQEEPCPIL